MKLKKRICTLFTLLVIGVLALVSCGGSGGGSSGGGSGNGGKPSENAVLKNGLETTIVYDANDFDKDTILGFGEDVYEITNEVPDFIFDTISKYSPEIVLGNSSRKITSDAQKRLNAMIKKEIRYSLDEDAAEEDLAGYTVYSDGESIAIVWSSDYGKYMALDYFKENYLAGDELCLEPGYSKTVIFSKTEYLAERADKMKAEAWAKLEEQLPDENSAEIIAAFKQLYSLYSSEIVVWLANLYDPAVGGFYYCPSARDNEGFLPDLESTYIALTYMGASGMAEMYGGDWAAATPDWLADAVCDWVISMRDPEDGYYYHVQWPKEYIEANGFQTRITRDKGSGNSVLQAFGRYSSTASIVELDGTQSLGMSTASAVSKVVAAADDMMWQFASTENFRTYIEGLDSRCAILGDAERAYQFYVYGNEFQSSVNLLNDEMREILINFFDKYQNPGTGMWSKNLYYNTTNGYHKVASVYNKLGATLKYTDKAVESTMEILCWSPEEHPTSAGVEYYNALSCLPYIYENIRNCGSGTDEEKAVIIDGYKAIVYANAPTMILNGYAQMTAFACPDGSFGTSTYAKGNGGKAQGVPIGIPGTKEGDIGGTYVASMDIIDYTMKALELEEYTVPLFTEQERYLFVKTLEGLGPVIKQSEDLGEHIVFDFEDAQNETDFPQDILLTQRESTVYIEEDEYGDNRIVFEAHNWYAQASTSSGRNSWFTINAPMIEQGANCGVIEISLAFDEVYNNQNDSFMIDFQNNAYGTIASFGFKYTVEGKYAYARMYDHNENDVGFALPSGSKEIKLRMEYYKAEAVIKIYVNDVFVKETDALARQGLDFNSAQFAFQGHSELTAFFDDICAERVKKAYVKETPNAMPEFDLPIFGRENYDFEDVPVGTRFPRHLTVNANNGKAEVTRDEYGTRALRLTGVNLPLQANPRASLLAYKMSGDANAYVFTTDITVDYFTDSEKYRNVGRIQLADSNGAEILSLRIRAKNVDGNTNLVVAEKSSLENILATIDTGYRITLKAVYYPEAKTVALYIDGEFAGASYVASAGAAVNRANVVVEAGVAATFTLDNIGITYRNVTESAPAAPDKPDGSESSTPSAYERPETPDGVHNFDFEGEYSVNKSQLSYSDGTQSTVDELIFIDGTLVRYDGGTNVHGATATVNGDENNKYLTIFAPKRVHDRDRAHMVTAEVSYTSSDANTYVCEMDIKLDSILPDGTASHKSYWSLMFAAADASTGPYIHYSMSVDADGFVCMGSQLGAVALGTWDTWMTVRFEFGVEDDAIRVYVKNSEGLYEYRGNLPETTWFGRGATTGSFVGLGSRIDAITISGSNSNAAGMSMHVDNIKLYADYIDAVYEQITYPVDPNAPTAPVVEDFEGKYTSQDVNLNHEGVTSTAKDYAFESGVTVKYDGKTNKHGATATVESEGGNKYLTLTVPKRVHDRDRAHSITVLNSYSAPRSVANVYQVDLKLDSKLSDGSASHNAYINFLVYSGSKYVIYTMKTDENGIICIGSPNGYVPVARYDEWFTLRFEFSRTDGTTGIFVKVGDGDFEYRGDIPKSSHGGAGDYAGLGYSVSSVVLTSANDKAGACMHVDNITLYADNKTLAKGTAVYPGGDVVIPDPTPEPEDPVSPTTPEVYDFEGDYTTATRQLENGGSAEEIFFENGVTVAYGGKANVQGATAEVVTDGDNKYITITAPKRVHDKDRSHQINVELYGDATGAKAYVYEMDLKIDSILPDGSASSTQYFNLMFYSGDLSEGRYIHYMMSETNGILSIISPDGSVAVAKVDEWFTLRIEFVIADGKAKAFVKNSSGEYDYRGDLPNTSWSAKAGSGNFSGLGSKVDTVIVSASHNNKAGFSMHIDNLSLTTTASTTSAGTVVPPEN